MADAYDVMSMAKRSGAQLQLEEDWDKYVQDIEAYQRSQSKGGFFKTLAQMGLNKLIPEAAKVAFKIAPGMTIMEQGINLALSGGVGGSITDALTQAIKGPKGSIPEFASNLKGPYGLAMLRKLKKGGERIGKGIRQSQEDERESDKLLSYIGSFGASADEWKNLFGDIGEGLTKEGKKFMENFRTSQEVGQENKKFLDFIGTTTGEIGGANDLENYLNSIVEADLGKGVADPSVGGSIFEGGWGTGAPADTMSKIQPTAMNISTPPQGLGLAPLSASEATSLPYKIPLPEIPTGTTNLPYSASSFAMPQANINPFSLMSGGMKPKSGAGIDTLGVLKNVSGQYKPESIIERLFPQMSATQNPMMKNLLQAILSGRRR